MNSTRPTAQAKGAARAWWTDTRASIDRQIAQMRADFEKWQAEMKQKNAEHAAESAEEDAAAAVALAGYCIDVANGP